jgi:hypothetical protein
MNKLSFVVCFEAMCVANNGWDENWERFRRERIVGVMEILSQHLFRGTASVV